MVTTVSAGSVVASAIEQETRLGPVTAVVRLEPDDPVIGDAMTLSLEVLAEAERIAGGERKTLEGLIAEMEEHRRQSDEERQIAENERIELETARREVEGRLAGATAPASLRQGEAVLDQV